MNGSTSIPSSFADRPTADAMTRTDSGFTLLEVLIAVAVTALLMLTVYGVFTPVSKAKERLETEGESYHLARVLFDRLGREIRGAYFSPQAGSKTRFQGGTDDTGRPFLLLSTTAATPQEGSAGGVVLVRYQLRDDAEAEPGSTEQVLLRGEAPLFVEDAERAPGYRLGTGIVGLKLRFFDGSDWQEQWPPDPSRPVLPQQVEVSLTLRAGAGELPFVTAFELPDL